MKKTYRNVFKPFRLQTGTVEELNREVDLIKAAFNEIEGDIANISLTPGPKGQQGDPGPAGPAGTGGFELQFSFGRFGGSGVLPLSEGPGVIWLLPTTHGDWVDVWSLPPGSSTAASEWKTDKSYTSARIDFYINDIIGMSGSALFDLAIMHNQGVSSIGVFGMNSGAIGGNSASGSLSVAGGDTVGMGLQYANGAMAATPGSIWLTGKVTLT